MKVSTVCVRGAWTIHAARDVLADVTTAPAGGRRTRCWVGGRALLMGAGRIRWVSRDAFSGDRVLHRRRNRVGDDGWRKNRGSEISLRRCERRPTVSFTYRKAKNTAQRRREGGRRNVRFGKGFPVGSWPRENWKSILRFAKTKLNARVALICGDGRKTRRGDNLNEAIMESQVQSKVLIRECSWQKGEECLSKYR